MEFIGGGPVHSFSIDIILCTSISRMQKTDDCIILDGAHSWHIHYTRLGP